ncbi:MAG: protein kinase [Bacteroidia bacterium]|nr:protein kinase [Bacteroidia bacterium]
MPFLEEIDKANELLAEGELGVAIDLIRNLLKEAVFKNESEVQQQFTHLSNQFNVIQGERNTNVLSVENYNIEQNKIVFSVIKFLDNLRRLNASPKIRQSTIRLFESKEDLRQYIDERLGMDYEVIDELEMDNIDGDRSIMFKVLDHSGISGKPSHKVVKVIKPFSILTNENILEVHPDVDQIEELTKIDGIITVIRQHVRSYPWFFLMPYIEGKSLKDHIELKTNFSNLEALHIIEVLLNTISICQANDHTFGALKPQQILINERAGMNPVISPFQFVQSTFYAKRTRENILSNCRYLSPEELANGTVNDRSIQFSLGLLTFELFSGKPFFQGMDAIQVVTNRIEYRKDPEKYFRKCFRKKNVPDGTASLIKTLLSPDHEDRFQDLKDVQREIRFISVLESVNVKPNITRIVKDSYERCRQDEQFYYQFFEEFFSKSEGSKQKFKNYPNLKEHFAKVDHTVEEILSIINKNKKKGKSKIQAIALSHNNQYMVTEKEFDVFQEVLFDTIKKYDSDWNQKVENAWKHTLDQIFTVVKECTRWLSQNDQAINSGPKLV